MGWTSTHYNKKEGITAFFEKEFSGDQVELLDSAFVNMSEWYGAFLVKETLEVFAAVVLVKWSKGYYNIHYKSMEETCGPYVHNCPERILNRLTPSTDGNAIRWREACREKKAFNKAIKLSKGTIIKSIVGIKFTDGTKANTFIIESVRPFHVRTYENECKGSLLFKMSKSFLFTRYRNGDIQLTP